MIDHLRESLRLSAEEPGGIWALAALAVSALAALALLGLLALHRVSRKATVATGAIAVGGWLGSVCIGVSIVRDGQHASLRLWHHATSDIGALNEATARAEAGHTLLALAVLGVCSFCAALALGRAVSALLRGTPRLRMALPATLALLTGAFAYGLARRIDLTYFEYECGAAFRCTEPVISGTVALADKLRTILLVGALAATNATLLVARRLSPPTRGGLVGAAVVFVVGAVSWGVTRDLHADATAPLPERRRARMSCGIALARTDSISAEQCSMCRLDRRGPVIEVRGALLTIDGKPEPPEALAGERYPQFPWLPVILIDPSSDWRATIRSLAEIRDSRRPIVQLALQEVGPHSVRSQTAGSAELPAQCCCLRVELVEGEAPRDSGRAFQLATETGKLPVGPKIAAPNP